MKKHSQSETLPLYLSWCNKSLCQLSERHDLIFIIFSIIFYFLSSLKSENFNIINSSIAINYNYLLFDY